MNLIEKQCVEDLADLLYNFLPGSGNSRIAFPLAASQVQCEDLWVGEASVRRSMTWRRDKGEPLTRAEVDELNVLLLRLSLKVPELNDPAFLASLPSGQTETETTAAPKNATLSDEQAQKLSARLIGLFEHPPQRRGFEYERFLTELFAA